MTTKEEIMKILYEKTNARDICCIDSSMLYRMNRLENPFELVEPILELIGQNPQVDFGTPGNLVLFVEQFYNCGYEELLMESVQKTPTAHNIWMLHRCFNDMDDPRHENYREIAWKLKSSEGTTKEIVREIESYKWE